MKKIFLIAASAMMVLASCTKVVINYPEDAQPQEIAMFAVNKSATKAPVPANVFPENYNMMVAAYLAAGDATAGVYFTDKTFSKNGNTWTGGQYWPVSAATLNFVAIAPQTANQVTTTISEKSETSEPGVATVTIADNQTHQNDVMYAVGQSSKTAGQKPGNVAMVFKHALSWINFTFNTANTSGVTIKINSVKINGAVYNGTLTVESSNYTTTSAQVATTSWSNNTTKIDDVSVPGTADGLILNTETADYQGFGSGLLVVPDVQATNFVINYTITQGDQVTHTFDYTYPLTSDWDAAKKYTYAVNITLSKIEIDPSVTPWEINDSDANTDGNQDIPVDAK